MFVFVVRSYILSYQERGYPLEGAFFLSFSHDAVTLALSDAVLILSTGLCVPFVKACVKGWIRYYWFGVIIQHLWQTTLLFTAIQWTFNRGWPWVQSGFLTLHSFVLVMKMHSYVTTNGQLQWVHQRVEKLYTQLRRAVADEGDWDAAIKTAQSNKSKQETAQAEIERRADGITNGTPMVPEGATSSYVDEKVAVALRRRLAVTGHSDVVGSASLPPTLSTSSSSEFFPDRPTQVNTTGTRLTPSSATTPPSYPPTPSQILAHHPNSQIADLAREHAELEEELTSTGPERVRWPANVTYKNFVTYMLIPTLVYEPEYPRTDRLVGPSFPCPHASLTVTVVFARYTSSRRQSRRSARSRCCTLSPKVSSFHNCPHWGRPCGAPS